MLVCEVVLNRALGGGTVGRKLCKNEVNYFTCVEDCPIFCAIQIIETKALGIAKIDLLMLFHICLIFKYLTDRVNHLRISHHHVFL